jgi:hypothetical protein
LSRTGSTESKLLDELDREAEAFDSALEREYYLNFSGQKEDLVLAPIFERHARLFSRETVDTLSHARREDSRRAGLREFVVGGYLENAARELTEEISTRESRDSVQWDGRAVPYRSLAVLAMNEADAQRRHRIDGLRLAATDAQNPLRERRWDVLHGEARALGYESYAALCDDVGRLGLEELAARTDRFLWQTERPYRARLEGYLRAMGLMPALTERSDISYLTRAPQFDGYFTAERLVPSLMETLGRLGVDTSRQANVHLDTEARPRKSPRAFSCAIRVPDEVVLVISPHGGQDDYRALFHEAGHAQHFAHVDRSLPFVQRGLGDNSITEAYAFLLEHLVHDPAWLREHLRVEEPGEYVALVRFHRLYMLRRYAAKLRYELELHGGDDPRSKAKRYADLLTATLGVRYSSDDYLFDVDDGFYCARYLRAWIFEAQLRRHLVDRFGRDWFGRIEAGDYLRGLWCQGQRFSVEELSRQLGFDSLDMGPLTAEVCPGLTVSGGSDTLQ